MESTTTITKDLGTLHCGQKYIDTIKIENPTKESRVYVVKHKEDISEIDAGRLHIQPTQAVAKPGGAARFTLSYTSHLEDIIDNFHFDVLEKENLVARLNVRAQSRGPCLSPLVHNLKFYYFRNVSLTTKCVEIVNTAKCEAKFYFDLDEDYQHLEISQRRGVIPSGLKIGLKFTFKPTEAGLYNKRIFCVVQFHKPIIFNIVGVYKPKLKIEPKKLKFRFPPEECFLNSYEAYMNRMKPVKVPEEEKSPFLLKCTEEYENLCEITPEDSVESVKCWSVPWDNQSDLTVQPSNSNLTPLVALTTRYMDIKNFSEVPKATTLLNLSKTQPHYFEWDHDPKGHFRMDPCSGFLQPNGKVHFKIIFTPSAIDFLYHTELDLRVFPCACNEEDGDGAQQVVDLPLTMSLRINGHSFPDDSCGWVPQCRITQKTLHLRSCVPDETVHATFMVERQGHLPVSFAVLPPNDPNYTVQPPLGYLSKSFQLFVVQFSSDSKGEGVYTEDLRIRFNKTNSNIETITLVTSVEMPKLNFGKCNSLTFVAVFPGSKASAILPIENPTNLHLSYEFVTPEDITWAEIVTPKGMIEPKSFGEVEVLFKPEVPCEYLDYIPCYVSSTSKPDCTAIINLQLIGSCQFGYLVATPGMHDFGEAIYLEKKSVKFHLYNFSPVLLHFKLSAVHRAFPIGDPEDDVEITPARGSLAPKTSLEVTVTITPHVVDIIQYAIICQNVDSDSEDALPRGEPRKIFLLRFEGICSNPRIVDLNVIGGGPLFSPHWIWRMINVERLNAGFQSPLPENEVPVMLPEAVVGSPPITIVLHFQPTHYHYLRVKLSKKTVCPCFQTSNESILGAVGCKHVTPSVELFGPETFRKKNVVMHLMLKNNISNSCAMAYTIRQPRNRLLTLNAVSMIYPETHRSRVSVYVRDEFSLKPVYIGDPHPPLQLFWLYNNTEQPASYVVEKVTLGEPATSVQRIIDCINPNGVIPPQSAIPLGFIFTPTELKTYTGQIVFTSSEDKVLKIQLKGTGIPYRQQFQELSIPKTIPQKTILPLTDEVLKCVENVINIPYFRVFSHIKRFFYIKNHSLCEEWSFRWHSLKIDDIVTVKIQPNEGVVRPGETAKMTLVMKSFAYPTALSFSVPCDVINYSQLKAHEMAIRKQQRLAEKYKDYFTITEKGISYEEPDVPIPEEPKPSHMFITVNANIVSSVFIDHKLSLQQQSILMAESEITAKDVLECPPKASSLPSIQRIMENLLWKTLISGNVKENLKRLWASQDYNYWQILPESKIKSEEIAMRLSALPSKYELQAIFEETIQDVIRNNFYEKEKQSTEDSLKI